jgi:hypothetical protein
MGNPERLSSMALADDSIRDAGIVSVCFDFDKQILKTEGVEYWRQSQRARL